MCRDDNYSFWKKGLEERVGRKGSGLYFCIVSCLISITILRPHKGSQRVGSIPKIIHILTVKLPPNALTILLTVSNLGLPSSESDL